jgi:medium-chain acyl-[acyl-carrier-protein] hydrolase
VGAVQLPGRGPRARELPLGRVDEIVDCVVPALESRLDLPYALFGIDVGALVMFEGARRLRREGKPLPGHLFVTAAMAPQVTYSPPMQHLPRERLLGGLHDLGASADEGAEAALRAECAAMQSYAYGDEAPFDFPLTAFLGERDCFIPPGAVRAWRAQTTARFDVRVQHGTHDLLREDPSPVLDAIRAALAGISPR